MGLKSCYSGGCPPASVQYGVYGMLNDCQANCQPEPIREFTCGISNWCSSGTCPTGYQCEEISSISNTWCACITGGQTGTVHPDWKVGGIYYNPR